MNREELFKNAVKKRIQEKEDDAQRGSFDFEPVTWSAMRTGYVKIIRILGYPASSREGDPFSPKIMDYSMVLGDNDKKFRCIWPLKEEDDMWIMWRVLQKVTSYTWDAAIDQPKYHYSESHPTIFNRVFKNSNVENRLEKGWRPSKTVLMNVIDRSMMDWHEGNKHTVLLSKKVGETNSGNFFYEPGTTITLYREIFDNVVALHGDWEDYDIAIKKYDQKPWYKAFYACDDSDDFKIFLEGFEVNREQALRPLTDEEREWERYDIDKLFKITSYKKIHNRLKHFFGQVDEAFKTHYLEELEELVEQEKSEKKGNEEEEKSIHSVEKPDFEKYPKGGNTPIVPQEYAEKSKDVMNDDRVEEIFETEEPKTTPRERKKAGVDWRKLSKELPGIDGMTDREKSCVESYDAEKGTFVYKEDSGQIYNCLNKDNGCGMSAPESFHACPGCGENFED